MESIRNGFRNGYKLIPNYLYLTYYLLQELLHIVKQLMYFGSQIEFHKFDMSYLHQ